LDVVSVSVVGQHGVQASASLALDVQAEPTAAAAFRPAPLDMSELDMSERSRQSKSEDFVRTS
jgi:hypothetical protein